MFPISSTCELNLFRSKNQEDRQCSSQTPQQCLESPFSRQPPTSNFVPCESSKPALAIRRNRISGQIQNDHAPTKTGDSSRSSECAPSLTENSYGKNATEDDHLRGIGGWTSTPASLGLEQPIPMFCPSHTLLAQHLLGTQHGAQNLLPLDRFLIEDPLTFLRHLDVDYASSFTSCSHCADIRANVLL